MSANFADPARLPVWLALGREVGAVAAARGVKQLGFGEFDPTVFAPGAPDGPQVATIAWLADYTSKTAKTHSGIWRDLAVRKRRPRSIRRSASSRRWGARPACRRRRSRRWCG